MRLLVCGSRDWTDSKRIMRELGRLLGHDGSPGVVIHGAALGADKLAGTCALALGASGEPFPADWDRYGRSAGPRRNEQMLREGRPDRGLAFGRLYRETNIRTAEGDDPRRPGWPTTGTGDMVKRLLRARLPVRWIADPDADAIDLTEMPRAT